MSFKRMPFGNGAYTSYFPINTGDPNVDISVYYSVNKGSKDGQNIPPQVDIVLYDSGTDTGECVTINASCIECCSFRYHEGDITSVIGNTAYKIKGYKNLLEHLPEHVKKAMIYFF